MCFFFHFFFFFPFFPFFSFFLFFCFLFFVFCFLFRATPVAYGSCQAGGWIRAAAASLHHSLWQHQICNPLNKTRDWTHILTETISGPWPAKLQRKLKKKNNKTFFLPGTQLDLRILTIQFSYEFSVTSCWIWGFYSQCFLLTSAFFKALIRSNFLHDYFHDYLNPLW